MATSVWNRPCYDMGCTENQRLVAKLTQPPKNSFRPRHDPTGTVDGHARPKVDYLIENEVKKLVDGAKAPCNPERDQLLILMLFRHGYGECEVIMAYRDWVDLKKAVIRFERLKLCMTGSAATTHDGRHGGDQRKFNAKVIATPHGLRKCMPRNHAWLLLSSLPIVGETAVRHDGNRT